MGLFELILYTFMFVQMTRGNLLYYEQVNVVFVNIKVDFSIF
jgi:hypothetical protein